jgi:hypothetical protein
MCSSSWKRSSLQLCKGMVPYAELATQQPCAGCSVKQASMLQPSALPSMAYAMQLQPAET